MGLIGWTLGLPFLPVRGVMRLGEVLQQQAEREMRDPAVARRQLEDVEERARSGEISPEEAANAEEEIAGRMAAQQTTTTRRGDGG